MKHIPGLITMILLLPVIGWSQTRNFVKEWTAAAPETDANNIMTRSVRDVRLSTMYSDGLGRQGQSVIKQGSLTTATGSNTDFVHPFEYDNVGREIKKYLPYTAATADGQFKNSATTDQNTWFSGGSSPVSGQGENTFYTQTNYEPSPLNRVVKQMSPGANWAGSGKGVTIGYYTNTSTDAVRIWNVTDVANDFGTYASPGVYDEGTLNKTITTDEQGHQSIEFIDKEGHMILKKVQLTAAGDDGTGSGYPGWLCTYYIYDDLNNLRCVIQPGGVVLLPGNGWDITALSGAILNEQCFRYEYDWLTRAIMRKVPGAAAVYMVYDSKDRLVMAQDGNMRANGSQWLCTLYDALDRPVLTGMIGYGGSLTDLQNLVTSQTIAPPAPNPNLPQDLELGSSTTGDYQAFNSITLKEGFSTPDGGSFSASIVAGADGQTSTVANVTVNLNPLPTGATLSVLTITHYDDYNGLPSGLSGSLVSSNYNAYLTASSGTPDYAQPIITSALTKGKVTWTQSKVLGTASQFISTVNIYNDKGSVVQTASTNITGGVDVTTNQYDFSGKLLNTHLKHQYLNGAGQTYEAATRDTYDDLHRVTKIEKNFNGAGYKTISAMEYDAVGEIKTKSLGTDPNNAPNPLEKIVYDYNIRGWVIGANRNYLTTEGQATDGTHFGFELGYDKAASSAAQNFTNSQLNGNIAGTIWKSDGDDTRRKYDFTYDAANRLFKADFVQQNPDDHLWNSSKVNYAVKMGDGTDVSTAYDANGNILRMQQWGWKTTTSDKIDDLSYSYYNNGNKLASVTDNATGGTSPSGTPGMYLGDFVDKNTGANDYGYDLNGNMVTDLNKRISGSTGVDLNSGGAITYNVLNLPSQIGFKKDDGSTKGAISYVYDAGGNKLEKITVEGSSTTTTWYAGGFVYQTLTNGADHSQDYTDRLQFALHEEGKIRYRPALGPLPAAFVYDFFLKDHLGNTRMVLTDEQQVDLYPPATLEGSITTDGSPNAIYVEKNYYTINPANVVDKSMATGITDYENKNGGNNATDAPVNNNPNAQATANSQKLYMLSATGGVGATGLGMTVKVMSGDKIDILGKSYWFQNNTSQNNYPVPVGDILAGLLGTPGGASGGHGVGLTDLTGQSAITNAVSSFTTAAGRNDNGTSTTPKAYINWILFDNNFKYVTGNFSRVGAANTVKDHYTQDPSLQNIQVTKNGYLYVYVENESPVNVFFDNLQVIHSHGALVEESHYYPFGLTMEGISDKAIKGQYAGNKYKYNEKELQNKEFSDGTGLEAYDYGARFMDPQIGQWRNIDPHATKYANASPYSYTENNPIVRIDPTGKDWVISTSTDENGNITIHITFTGAILNSGSTSAGDVAKFQTAAESQLKNAYTQSYPQTITVPQTVTVLGATQEVSVTKAIQINVSIDVNLRVINKKQDLASNEHLIEITPSSGFSSPRVFGQAQYYGRYVQINESAVADIISGANQKTVPHEVGHTGGLVHPNDDVTKLFGYTIYHGPQFIANGVQDNNLMFQSGYQQFTLKNNSAGNYVNINQIHILQANYNNGKLNHNNIPK